MKYRTTILILITLLCTACTDRITYKHTQDPNEIIIKYSEGIGNSTKTAINVSLADGSTLKVGNSTTDQKDLIKALTELTKLLRKLAITLPIQ